MHFLVIDGGYDYWERAGRVQRPVCLKAELFGRPDALGVDHQLVMQISGAFRAVLEGFDTYNYYQLRGPQLVALVGSLRSTQTSNPT